MVTPFSGRESCDIWGHIQPGYTGSEHFGSRGDDGDNRPGFTEEKHDGVYQQPRVAGGTESHAEKCRNQPGGDSTYPAKKPQSAEPLF